MRTKMQKALDTEPVRSIIIGPADDIKHTISRSDLSIPPEPRFGFKIKSLFLK